MRSQLENLPQPDHQHIDQHESNDIVKMLSMIFIVFYLINIEIHNIVQILSIIFLFSIK